MKLTPEMRIAIADRLLSEFGLERSLVDTMLEAGAEDAVVAKFKADSSGVVDVRVQMKPGWAKARAVLLPPRTINGGTLGSPTGTESFCSDTTHVSVVLDDKGNNYCLACNAQWPEGFAPAQRGHRIYA